MEVGPFMDCILTCPCRRHAVWMNAHLFDLVKPAACMLAMPYLRGKYAMYEDVWCATGVFWD